MSAYRQLRQGMLFNPGQIIATAGVSELINNGQIIPSIYLNRHLHGDWGDLSSYDKELNRQALRYGDRLMSSYKVADDLTLWVITECDRSVTTLLLPSEY